VSSKPEQPEWKEILFAMFVAGFSFPVFGLIKGAIEMTLSLSEQTQDWLTWTISAGLFAHIWMIIQHRR
jgi:hypothetical protein